MLPSVLQTVINPSCVTAATNWLSGEYANELTSRDETCRNSIVLFIRLVESAFNSHNAIEPSLCAIATVFRSAEKLMNELVGGTFNSFFAQLLLERSHKTIGPSR